MEKETKRSRKNERLRPFFQPTHKDSECGSRFYIPGDKLTTLLRAMRDNERHCFFAWLVDRRKHFIEGEKEVLEIPFKGRAFQFS